MQNEITEREAVLFRDDLRKPEIAFGRCAVTGEFGSVVAIDLGDISVQVPDHEEGVEYDEETGKAKFTKWNPVVFNCQASLSVTGLEHLLAWAKNQDTPMPTVTPELYYQWIVRYTNGSALAQFKFEDGVEVETNSSEIDYSNVEEITLSPRRMGLPTYSYRVSTQKFFKDGEEIDTDYLGAGSTAPMPIYFRRVTNVFGSGMGTGLNREISVASSSVLQVFGWSENRDLNTIRSTDMPCNLIAVDEFGNWRAWRQQ